MSDREKLAQAFKELEGYGFATRMAPWVCCQSCGCGDIEKEYGPEKSYLFWNDQADEYSFGEWEWDWPEDADDGTIKAVGQNLIHPLYLTWQGDLGAIYFALQRAGLVFFHDGDPDTAIKITTWALEAQETTAFAAEVDGLS